MPPANPAPPRDESTAASGRAPSAALALLHLSALGALATGQPVLDVLRRSPELFVVHGSGWIDLLLLCLAVCFAAPLALWLVARATTLLSPRLADRLHDLGIAALAGLLALPAVREIGTRASAIGLAVLLGAAVAILYRRFALVRSFASFLGIAVLAVPLAFLLSPAIRDVATGRGAEIEILPRDDSGIETPVFLVVFDELALPTLLASPGQVDDERYPAFADLASRSTWYVEATAVSVNTLVAVPAIFTGLEPTGRRLPNAAGHPRSIFTLLGASFTPHVAESLTQLCPPEICREAVSRASLPRRLRSLGRVSLLLYLHLALPPDLTSRLPPIDLGWAQPEAATEGVGDEEMKSWLAQRLEGNDARRIFETFVAGIPEDGTPLAVIHATLPHVPWRFLPSGRRYGLLDGPNAPHGLDRGRWLGDPLHAEQGFQRYLLQLGFVDRLLGTLLDELERRDLFERSLVIVTADHGVSFRPGAHRREATEANAADILSIPLFVKYPGQRRGRIDRGPATSLDVLPTILDVLGRTSPWPLDGETLRGKRTARAPTQHTAYRAGGSERRSFSFPPKARRKMWRAMAERFGTGALGPEFYGFGPFRDLVGRDLESLDLGQPSGDRWLALYRPRITEPFTADPPWPGYVAGRIEGPGVAPDDELHLAVAIDGEVVATTSTFHWASTVSFRVMLPEGKVAPRAEVAFYALAGPPERPLLQRLAAERPLN